MRKITQISIHCSDTSIGSAIAYDKYHREHNHWSAIGYHYVILNGNAGNGYESMLDGSLEVGRSINQTPAAVRGYNKGMIAICLTGTEESGFTMNQFETLYKLLKYLMNKYKVSSRDVKGHRDYPKVTKNCPCFEVSSFVSAMESSINFEDFVKILSKEKV